MDEKDFLLKSVHEEFAKRVSDENNRQNHRIEALENTLSQLLNMSVSVEKLATNMEHMVIEQKEQGERLKVLENKDGDMWRKVVSYAVTAILSIIIGFIFSKLGM